MIEHVYIDKAQNGYILTIVNETDETEQYIAHTWHDVIEKEKELVKEDM